MTLVTRSEIADHVEEAFSSPAVSPAALVDQARRSGARPAVIAQLRRLRRAEYGSLRDLWSELGDLPVEDESPSRR